MLQISSHRLSVGMTPKTLRLPKPGEMLLSVRGSPLGVYKEEENMEAIHGIFSLSLSCLWNPPHWKHASYLSRQWHSFKFSYRFLPPFLDIGVIVCAIVKNQSDSITWYNIGVWFGFVVLLLDVCVLVRNKLLPSGFTGGKKTVLLED